LREFPLPEPDEVEPLEDDEVARVVGEMRAHPARGVGALALDQDRQTLDVTPLAIGLRGGRDARDLRGVLSLREALFQEQTPRRPRMREREPGIERDRLAKAVERAGVPRQ